MKISHRSKSRDTMEISDDNLWWAGGHFDGDGCIAVHYGGLTLQIGKAEKGMASLHKMQAMFGGSITKQRKKEVENWQPSWQWRIGSEAARKLCERLAPYVHAKRPQFELAATMPPDAQCVQVLLSHPEEPSRRFESVCEAERELALTGWRIRAWAKRKEDRGGWTCELLVPDREAKRQQVEEIDQQLRAMKQMEHRPVDRFLPDAYFAGFFDADGSFSISSHGCNAKLQLGQKWRAILDAAEVSFGGHVSIGVKACSYQVGLQNGGLDAVQRMLPFLVEKRDQAEIVLALTTGNVQESKVALGHLQGNKNNKNKRKMMV